MGEEKQNKIKGKYIIKDILERPDIKHNLERIPSFISKGYLGYYSERSNPLSNDKFFNCDGPKVTAWILDNHYILDSSSHYFCHHLSQRDVFGVEDLNVGKEKLKLRMLEKMFFLFNDEMRGHSDYEYEIMWNLENELVNLGIFKFDKDFNSNIPGIYKKILNKK